MKKFLFLLLILPLASLAQINRSANELAKERVEEYIVKKLFKDLTYRPVDYGELKSQKKQKESDVIWSISHRFEVIDSLFVSDKKIAVAKPCFFSFFLDKKLKVVGAESYLRE